MTPPSSRHPILQLYKETNHTQHTNETKTYKTTKHATTPTLAHKTRPAGIEPGGVWFEDRLFTLCGVARPMVKYAAGVLDRNAANTRVYY